MNSLLISITCVYLDMAFHYVQCDYLSSSLDRKPFSGRRCLFYLWCRHSGHLGLHLALAWHWDAVSGVLLKPLEVSACSLVLNWRSGAKLSETDFWGCIWLAGWLALRFGHFISISICLVWDSVRGLLCPLNLEKWRFQCPVKFGGLQLSLQHGRPLPARGWQDPSFLPSPFAMFLQVVEWVRKSFGAQQTGSWILGLPFLTSFFLVELPWISELGSYLWNVD